MEVFRLLLIPTIVCSLVFIGALFFIKKMAPHERLILVILLMNASADLIAEPVREIYQNNGIVYNILTPLEKIVTLIIYWLNTQSKKGKVTYAITIALIVLTTSIGFAMYKSALEIHFITLIATSILVAVASYFHLREIVTDRAIFSTVMVGFSLANLIYYTLMVSSASSIPLAYSLSPEFATKIYSVNLIAYGMWSIIIFTGIIWKKSKSSSFLSS